MTVEGLLSRLGTWWADRLLEHPLACGLAVVVFLVGWIFQQTTKLMYPDYATRPTWARWFVAFGDVMTTDISNVLHGRWPGKEAK